MKKFSKSKSFSVITFCALTLILASQASLKAAILPDIIPYLEEAHQDICIVTAYHDMDGNGTIDANTNDMVIKTIYDPERLGFYKRIEIDSNADGQVDMLSSTEWEGNTEITYHDTNANEVIDADEFIISSHYSPEHPYTPTLIETDLGGNGSIDLISTNTWEGTTQISHTDNNANQQLDEGDFLFTYYYDDPDKANYPTKITQDTNGDGNIDSQILYSWEGLTRTEHVDNNLNGSVDPDIDNIIIYKYDPNRDHHVLEIKSDQNADGVFEMIQSSSWEGNTETTLTDNNANDQIDPGTDSIIKVEYLDSLILAKKIESDIDADGNTDSITTYEYIYCSDLEANGEELEGSSADNNPNSQNADVSNPENNDNSANGSSGCQLAKNAPISLIPIFFSLLLSFGLIRKQIKTF